MPAPGLRGASLALALALLAALVRQARGQTQVLSEQCYEVLDKVIRDDVYRDFAGRVVPGNYSYWSKRANTHCKVKFQNGVQNCCGTTGVIPLLTKRGAITYSTYSGWYDRYERPAEYQQKWTDPPVPIPTPQPSPQPIPAPTPRPTSPAPPPPPSTGNSIDDGAIQAATPKPTPFGNIRPPPLPQEILLLASPAAPVMFALSGSTEGGVDLSGSAASPPPAPKAKRCDSNCKIDCKMRERNQICIKHNLGRSCILQTMPLNDKEVMDNLHERTPKEKAMLEALATLTVEEDICIPEVCTDADLKSIVYAFFPGETQNQMIITCFASGGGAAAGYAILAAFLSVSCFACMWFVMKPPKLVREYKIRRADD